jgi:hypothetical protein
VRSTPLAQVRREIARSLGSALPRGAPWLLGDPAAALIRSADSLARTWETLVGPTWPATRLTFRTSRRQYAPPVVALPGAGVAVSGDVE